MLSKVTAKHPLSQDPPLSQPLARRAGAHEGAEKPSQLPTWPGHSCGDKGRPPGVSTAAGLVAQGQRPEPLFQLPEVREEMPCGAGMPHRGPSASVGGQRVERMDGRLRIQEAPTLSTVLTRL